MHEKFLKARRAAGHAARFRIPTAADDLSRVDPIFWKFTEAIQYMLNRTDMYPSAIEILEMLVEDGKATKRVSRAGITIYEYLMPAAKSKRN